MEIRYISKLFALCADRLQSLNMQITNFLKKENLMLKQQNKELQHLLGLNRQALRLSTQFRKGQQNFPALVNLLYQQNSKLHAKIKELSTELETGICHALISEQIAFASTEQEKYLTNELKDKLTRMRRELENREKKIVELTKHESDKKGAAGEVKTIEWTDMNALVKKYKDENNDLYNEIEQKSQETAKYKDQKQQLLKLNLILTKQINEYKSITSQLSTGSNDMNSNDLSKFMAYQKKIIEDEDDPESDEEYLHDEDSSSNSSDVLSNPDDSKLNATNNKMPKLDVSKIPKLQLAKAKEIQELIVQKINNEDNKKKGVVKEDKVKKMETEMAGLRKKIGALMLEKIEIEKENNFLKKYVKQLECRNELLTQYHKQKPQTTDLNRTFSLMSEINRDHQRPQTETLLDMCRDVTLNGNLKKVLNGYVHLPYNADIVSYQI